jgi:hypothetical protein
VPFPPTKKTLEGLLEQIQMRLGLVERRLAKAQASLTIPDPLSLGTLRLTSTNDLSPTSTNHAFQVGPDSGVNIGMDGNEIMARNNGVAAQLNINIDGGPITLGSSATPNTINQRGYSLQPDLPEPVIKNYSTAVNTITASAWGTAAPGIGTVSLTFGRACWVEITMGGWLSAPTGDLRAGVAVSGATVIATNETAPGENDGSWGQIMWIASAYYHRTATKLVKVNAGTNVFTMQAYTTGSGTRSLNYPIFHVIPLRYV